MSLSSPFFGPRPMTTVSDENGVQFDAGPATFGEDAPGKPFFFVNDDENNKYGHILSESEISYPTSMLPAIKHDWMKRGYSESAIQSYMNNFNNPATFVIEYNESTGAVELVINRGNVANANALPIDLNTSNSLIARIAFGTSIDIPNSDPESAAWSLENAVMRGVLFATPQNTRIDILLGQEETNRVIKAFLSKDSFMGYEGGFVKTSVAAGEGGQASSWVAAINTALKRMGSDQYDVSASLVHSRSELAALVGLEGVLPFESSTEFPAFTEYAIRTFISDFDLPDGSLLVYGSLGLVRIDGLKSDPLAKVIKCIYPSTSSGNLVKATRLPAFTAHGNSVHDSNTVNLLVPGIGIMIKQSYSSSKFITDALSANGQALDLLTSGFKIAQVNFGVSDKITDALAVGYLLSIEKKFGAPSAVSLALEAYRTGASRNSHFVTAASRAEGQSYVTEGTFVDHDTMINEIWPKELPKSGLCYSALPSSKQERFRLMQARNFRHTAGYKVVMCNVSMIRIRTTAKMISDLIEFKASVPGQTADEKAVLDKARADLGTNVERDIFFTEYTKPITLVKDCVKTLSLYKKFKDAVDIYEQDLISADNDSAAVTFKAAQNRVNASLERRIFGHSFFEPFVPATSTDYEVSKVVVKISNSPSSSDRLKNEKTGALSPFIALLCYKSTGNPVPFDSVLDESDILYWIFNGCDVEVDDSSIADENRLDYVFNVIFGKTYEATVSEVGSSKNEKSFDLDITPFMDPLGFFDWSFVPLEQRGLVSLMMAGVPANDALALQLKRLFSFNVGSAIIGPEFFSGMVKSS